MNEKERKESVMKLFQITRMISTLRTKFLQGAPCSSELADDIDYACSYIYSAFERVKDFEPEGAKEAKEAIAVRCPDPEKSYAEQSSDSEGAKEE